MLKAMLRCLDEDRVCGCRLVVVQSLLVWFFRFIFLFYGSSDFFMQPDLSLLTIRLTTTCSWLGET